MLEVNDIHSATGGFLLGGKYLLENVFGVTYLKLWHLQNVFQVSDGLEPKTSISIVQEQE
jgi:hypothetical protein